MEEYTLVNRFTERYETGGRWRVRSREGRIFLVERFVLKKKRVCEREEEDGTPVRTLASLAPCNPSSGVYL
jgi:hypothetical protein